MRQNVPWLARLWGDGLSRSRPLAISSRGSRLVALRSGGASCRRALHRGQAKPLENDSNAQRLMGLLTDEPNPKGLRHYYTKSCCTPGPKAWSKQSRFLNAHPDEVERVLLRYGYTDPGTIGGYLDRDLPNPLIDRN